MFEKKRYGKTIRIWWSFLGSLLVFLELNLPLRAYAAAPMELTAPNAILIEASTGQVIFEKNADDRVSPASITKIMTLLLTFEQIRADKAKLTDDVLVSEHAASMGGSQVYLAQGETQTLDTMLKCIAVSSGNDASVAVAEYIAGSEEAFVKRMNDKAAALGMTGTHFVDCCGLTTSDDHYTTARDVAIMSRELIREYPEVYDYTGIWMEDITHVTRQGSSVFTLSSTNKLLKRYPFTTGLKTGSTQKAKYCISATASKDGIELIAVVMGAPDPKARFSEAQTLLTYGYASCRLYHDEELSPLPELTVKGGVEPKVRLAYDGEFSYLDLEGLHFDEISKETVLEEEVQAPIKEGTQAGSVIYTYQGVELGRLPILYAQSVEQAGFGDYLRKVLHDWLFS